jgi:hypothetical protein
MFYQEQIQDGVLCWRNSPDGAWQPFTVEELTKRIRKMEKRLHYMLDQLMKGEVV